MCGILNVLAPCWSPVRFAVPGRQIAAGKGSSLMNVLMEHCPRLVGEVTGR